MKKDPLFPKRPDKASLLREWTGPLTNDLVQQPGAFGLGQLPRRLDVAATTTSICGFCGTGCQLEVHLNKEGEAINLSASTEYPVNLGMACPKGWESLTPLEASDRGTTPLLRDARGEQRPASWDEALGEMARRFKKTMQEHGPESVAWLGTGQIAVEEFAFLGALAKFGMGFVHGDGNTRQCMATAVAAYKESFGFDSPPFTYQDFEESDCLIFVGSNLCIAHPIMWQRVMRNQRNPDVIVVDPRRTETAMAATEHLAIEPKSDLTLFYAVAREVIHQGWVDRDFVAQHTNDFAEFAAFVEPYTLEKAAGASGLSASSIQELARKIGTRERVSFWWTMGVNQSYEGTRLAQALINLALLTGNIGKPGTGANSITGQCNAMGSRLFSNTTNLLGGHQFTEAADRRKVAGVLGIPEERIPQQNSLAYDQILEAVGQGKIKALWIIATNPLHSWIEQNRFKERLEKLDCLVVQDMYANTLTAQSADIYLPAAGWGEKDGTFINSERRIGTIRKVRKAPGQALADFQIFRALAHHWGVGEMFREWTCPEEAFQILKKLSVGQPCDFSGIRDYAHLEESGGIQWPWPAEAESEDGKVPAQRRLFGDGKFFTADQRARFCFEKPRPQPESPCGEYPYILLTGRGTSSQWHTGTRTEKSDVLRKLYPRGIYVEINAEDAQKLGLQSGDKTLVQSRRGHLEASAFVCQTVPAGKLFISMHYREVNRLTREDVDPYSREPNFKICAVSLKPLR
ncbi:MAG: molybdopterin-dependent oxidoreductase [Opitutales bacterium]|nr:molybdopterin-dependent oxidoreductase [Opitutales bacterium]